MPAWHTSLRKQIMADPKTSENDPKFVIALSRGLALLRAYRPNEVYLSNQDFATRTGLPKTTVTRLTYTLCKLGYLVQAEEHAGEYRLGPGVLALGYGILSGLEFKDRVQLELADICRGDNPNVASAMGERYEQHVVYLVTHRSPDAVSMMFHVGGRVPLFHSSIGRAVLMGSSEEVQDALLAQALETEPASEHDRLRAGLARARADYAQYGYCTSFGEWRKEINSIAAPVRSADGRRVYAVNVGGFAFLNSTDDLMTHYAPRLLRAINSLNMRPGTDV